MRKGSAEIRYPALRTPTHLGLDHGSPSANSWPFHPERRDTKPLTERPNPDKAAPFARNGHAVSDRASRRNVCPTIEAHWECHARDGHRSSSATLPARSETTFGVRGDPSVNRSKSGVGTALRVPALTGARALPAELSDSMLRKRSWRAGRLALRGRPQEGQSKVPHRR